MNNMEVWVNLTFSSTHQALKTCWNKVLAQFCYSRHISDPGSLLKKGCGKRQKKSRVWNLFCLKSFFFSTVSYGKNISIEGGDSWAQPLIPSSILVVLNTSRKCSMCSTYLGSIFYKQKNSQKASHQVSNLKMF